jgi:hypothetical protein
MEVYEHVGDPVPSEAALNKLLGQTRFASWWRRARCDARSDSWHPRHKHMNAPRG